jgi:hypothetical protein
MAFYLLAKHPFCGLLMNDSFPSTPFFFFFFLMAFWGDYLFKHSFFYYAFWKNWPRNIRNNFQNPWSRGLLQDFISMPQSKLLWSFKAQNGF